MSGIPPFDPDAGEPGYLWEAVAAHLAARIEAGDIPPGGRLPGEQALATEYGVALMTARRAIRALRERGLVRTLPSKGTYVIKNR